MFLLSSPGTEKPDLVLVVASNAVLPKNFSAVGDFGLSIYNEKFDGYGVLSSKIPSLINLSK
jgi:hypothetical protein